MNYCDWLFTGLARFIISESQRWFYLSLFSRSGSQYPVWFWFWAWFCFWYIDRTSANLQVCSRLRGSTICHNLNSWIISVCFTLIIWVFRTYIPDNFFLWACRLSFYRGILSFQQRVYITSIGPTGPVTLYLWWGLCYFMDLFCWFCPPLSNPCSCWSCSRSYRNLCTALTLGYPHGLPYR